MVDDKIVRFFNIGERARENLEKLAGSSRMTRNRVMDDARKMLQMYVVQTGEGDELVKYTSVQQDRNNVMDFVLDKYTVPLDDIIIGKKFPATIGFSVPYDDYAGMRKIAKQSGNAAASLVRDSIGFLAYLVDDKHEGFRFRYVFHKEVPKGSRCIFLAGYYPLPSQRSA